MSLQDRIRKRLRALITGPAAGILDGALRDLIEEVIDARGLVRRAEIDAVEHRVEGLRRELAERHAELSGLTQALDAMARDLDDDVIVDTTELEERLDQLDVARKALQERLDRAHGALAATSAQVASFATRIEGLEERADKAAHVAASAVATAEAAVDGVSGLEQRLAAR